jgi:flavin reductase (DIM6/NTAB) family NADH-FMN oxidoreductase RutF
MDVQRTFDRLAGLLDYSMFIVTARAPDGEPLGCLVGFATQTSIDPGRMLVCLSRTNRTYTRGRDAEHLGVHWIPAEAADLAELFGGATGDEVDKFARTPWADGPCAVPILARCPNWIVGRVLARFDVGDHDGYLLEPRAAQAGAAGAEFSFHRAKAIAPGHAP